MVVEHYISDLLYRYNCVVVPNFGAFITQKTAARIDTATNTFFAPSKSITFNEQLITNDGLLVSHIAQSEQITFETALVQIEALVKKWNQGLSAGDKLSLQKIGSLWANAEGKLQFQPSEQINYLTSSFGLASFNSIPVTRETLKEEVLTLEEEVPFIISPEKRNTTSFRPLLKYAAIALLALSTGVTGYRMYEKGIINNQVVRQNAQKEVAKQIQEATFFNTAPLELPTVSVEVTASSKENTTRHHIVAGAFRVRANANRKIASLKQKGYNAAYYGINIHGLHMVTYDRFTNAQEALNALRKIKQEHSRDAWLLSEK